MENFLQIVKKIIITKAKANLRLQATRNNMDQQYLQGSLSANSTMAKNYGQSIKNSQKKKPKVQAPELITLYLEPSAKARRKKKYRCKQKQQD